MKQCDGSELGSNAKGRWFGGRGARIGVVAALLLATQAAMAERYGFETGEETWTAQNWGAPKDRCTNVVQSSFWGYGGSAHSLRMDCVLSNDGDTAVAGVAFAAQNLTGSQITMRVYCPTNASGSHPQSWAWTQLRLWVKDSHYNYQETLWDAFTIPPGNTTQYIYHTVTAAGGFDSTNVSEFGLQAYWRGYGTYTGALYVDDAGFGVPYEVTPVHTTDVQYSFEPNKEGWIHEAYVDPDPNNSLTGIVAVAQSADAALEAAHALRMDCGIRATGTNRQKGAASVDMRWYPPATPARAPYDLEGTTIYAYVYCPEGSESGSPANPNLVKLAAKSTVDGTNWYTEIGAPATMKNGQWVEITLAPSSNAPGGGYMEPGFCPTSVAALAVMIDMSGTYTQALYLDNVCFGVRPSQLPPVITDSQHHYDFGADYQQAWWKFVTNPDGWEATAWTNVFYGTNSGVNGSVALAANAAFATNATFAERKGVFEIAYQPALNLATKDHRKIQAKLRFEPAVEGLLSFDASINVFDKVTDQWYTKAFKIGGSGWNVLTFDLDDTNEYVAGSPVPMTTEAIGFITIQVFANVAWTGTVYLDDVVAGGRETGTNYVRVTSDFVRPSVHKFVIGGTNFYFCGANIEYLQTVPDATVTECLDWASSNGLQVVRTWAMQEGKPYSFQPQRGVWNELMFEHLDRIVAEAGHRNIRLMLGLVDNWAHNGGIFQYVHWVVKEHPDTVDTNLNKEGVLYHDQFWTNVWCKQWYKTYVTRLLNRTNSITGVVYKDDPTVFAWEIVNEPRCESDFGGSRIHDWLREMSDFVRTIDTNHMLGNGEEGGYVNTYDFSDSIPWEDYPYNYYHYATYATGVSTCDLYGCGRGHGVDFISDNRSEATYVQWQGGFYTNRDPVQGEWRAGNSNINFCTARIYVDQKEYNVWRTNVFGADQRLEWINDHWFDAQSQGALNPILKPMILEEFGIHAIGWIFNGSYGQVQLQRTPEYTIEDRVNIYSQYYAHIERSGISGSFFWNFGYEGMWNDRFHACDEVVPWYADTGYGAATSVAASAEHVLQGSNSLKLSWSYSGSGVDRAIFKCPTNEEWVLRVDNNSTNEPPTHGVNRTKFFWNFYNPNAYDVKVSLAVVGGPNWYWCEGAPTTLTAGWNRVIFDLSAGRYGWVSNGWANSEYLIKIPNEQSNVLEDVKSVGLVFRDLPAGEGHVFVDDIQIKRDDGFVVYADDPVNPVIKAHAAWCSSRNLPTNAPANQAPVASNLWFAADPYSPTPIQLAASDADGDVLSYRIVQRPQHGWVFGTPPDRLVYSPKLGDAAPDSFTYVANDGRRDSAEAVVTLTRGDLDFIRYDFEAGTEGWYANMNPDTGVAVTSVTWTTERAFHGTGSLRADLRLRGDWHTNEGDAEVNMEYDPPPGLRGPFDLEGQTLSISVYCPAGAGGTNTNPNRLQIYAKDTQWREQYGAETNIVEGQWVTLTVQVSTNNPPGGWTRAGFNPQQIRAIGVRIHHGGAGSDYDGPIFIDVACFPLMEHRILYSFDQDAEQWTTEDWGFGHATLTWTNAAGNPGAGALVVSPAAGASYAKFYVKDQEQVENQNVLFRPIYRAYVYVPADAPANVHHAIQVSLVLRSSVDGWAYGHESAPVRLTPGQWNLVEWDMSSVPVEVLMHADEWGIEIIWPNRDVWSGAVLVDSIQAVGREPAEAPSVLSAAPATNSVGKYQKLELTVALNGVDGLNPYDPGAVDLRGQFTSPSGRVWNVCGFYLEGEDDAPGQGTWRIRFAPNELGSWSYRVSVANAKGSNQTAQAFFTCAASDRHGWIRVSENDGHYFEHDDDAPFVGKGYCHPWDGDDEGIFANCEEHGINMIHWWMAPWDTMLTVKPAYPWEKWRENASYDTYEQTRAAELDRIIGYAEKHNVKLVFTIWPHDAIRDFNYHKWRINGSWQRAFDHKYSEPEWYINAFSELDRPAKNQKFFYDSVYKEYQDRLYRYIIARWGYSEAIGTWALASEMFGTFANSANCIDYQDPLWVTNKNALFGEDPYLHIDESQADGNDYTVPWLSYINGYFKTNDPFGHPTTASYATDEYWDGGFPVVDVPQIHTYADLYNWITPPTTVSKYHHVLREEYDKPAFMGEIGTVEWQTFEPDFTRVCVWPAICSGAAITPMMWTTPAFSWFGDAKMGPWLESMSDEMKVLNKFLAGIEFHKLGLAPADVTTKVPGEPAVALVESFEGGINSWQRWGNGSTNMVVTTNHPTHGSQSLRLDVNMDTYANMPEPATGIQKYEGDGFSYNWSNYWPRGTLKMDVFVPEFYHPTDNPDGFLLGINKDPRAIVEIFTKDEGGGWHWYSTTNEYGGPGREADGWKKLTVGMLWNLELPLSHIPTAYEASHIAGLKFWFGDVGILRGPIYLDNITAGMYAYSTYGMVASNGHFAFAWIQDRTWSEGFIASNAVFEINGLNDGAFHLEWWSTRNGIVTTFTGTAASGKLTVTVPDFEKDIAVKIRRIGSGGGTVHNVAVAALREYDWVLRNPHQLVYVLVENRGTAEETFQVTLTDTTTGQIAGTNTVTLGAGEFTHTRFTWDSMSGPSDAFHSLAAYAVPVPGESDLSDNALSGQIRIGSLPQPWDPCDRLRRWGPDSTGSDGRQVTVSTNRYTQGRESFEFYHRSPEKSGASLAFDNVYENWSNYSGFVFDTYIGDGSTNVQLLLRTGADWTWHYSRALTVTSGWNRDLLFEFASNTWTRVVWNPETQSNEYWQNVPVAGLEAVQQLYIKFTGYPDEGVVYLDNMRLDGCYILHLGYLEDMDFFPRAPAEQSNYTAAACCWMIARYLNGESFTQSQQQIYGATSHDPAHNSEITPASCASWMLSNVEPGYYFDDRYQTNLDVALRETVYWMDYIPPGGLQTPVYIVCGTNWSYKVVRGFHTNKKPYGSGEWGCWLDPKYFSVYGLWLNDPAVNGLGYNLYVSATEMAGIFQPSTANGQFWFVAEPPDDPARVAQAEEAIENSVMTLEPAEPNPALASFLRAKFQPSGPRKLSGGGDPDLLVSIPAALRDDGGFMSAFEAGGVVGYYAVNTNRPDAYYLAAGGLRGPGTTRYVLKLATNGAMLQATWNDDPAFYQPLPLNAADWAAREQFEPGSTVQLESNELVALPGLSPFLPAWQLVYTVDGTTVFSQVRADVDLSGDADDDGMSDGEELYAGLDPTNSFSVFSVVGGRLQSQGPDQVVVSWPSTSNKTYGIYRSNSLRQPFSALEINIPATPPMNVYTNQPPSATTFYRVTVE